MHAHYKLNYGTCKLVNMLCVNIHLITFSMLEFTYFTGFEYRHLANNGERWCSIQVKNANSSSEKSD